MFKSFIYSKSKLLQFDKEENLFQYNINDILGNQEDVLKVIIFQLHIMVTLYEYQLKKRCYMKKLNVTMI